MSKPEQRNLVVIGDNASVWVVALSLAQGLRGHGKKIWVVEYECEQPSVLGTTPATQLFHKKIGLNDTDLLQQTQGCFTLGTRFQNWSQSGSDYIQTLSPIGSMQNGVLFHHLLNRFKRHQEHVEVGDYSVEAQAAFDHRMITTHTSETQSVRYGLQLDEQDYMQMLRRHGNQLGIEVLRGHVTNVVQNHDLNTVTRLELDQNRALDVDFIFDCGLHRLPVLNDALDTKFDDWSDWFPCDRTVTTSTQHRTPYIPSHTSCVRHDLGWITETSTASQHHLALSYSSSVTTDQDAVSVFADYANVPKDRTVCTSIPQRGAMTSHWQGNYVALGYGASFSHDFLVSGLHLAQSGVMRWLELYPGDQPNPLLAQEYNRALCDEVERVRDAHVAYTWLAPQDSTAWHLVNHANVPSSLRYLVNVFENTGVLPFNESDSLTPASWINLLLGMGKWPQRYDPLSDERSLSELTDYFVQLQSAVKRTVTQQPSHIDVLKSLHTNLSFP